MDPSGMGMTKAGRVCGIITVVLLSLAAVFGTGLGLLALFMALAGAR